MKIMKIINMGVERVHPGRFQPRDREQITAESVADLVASIKKVGILNPLIAVGLQVEGPIEVELVAGERRLVAAKLAGLVSVPVRLVDGDEADLFAISIVDNLQRADLSVIEEARALQRMQELYGQSQRALAKALGKSQAWVQQRLALLKVAPEIQELVNTRVFDLAHARALAGLPVAVQSVAATHLNKLQEQNVPLTSRQVEGMGRRIKKFLNPAKFEGAEQMAINPELRNAMVATRWLLMNEPGEQLSIVMETLLSGDKYAGELFGRKTFNYLEDVTALVRLLCAPEAWNGRYDRSIWWSNDLARSVGRTCTECIFWNKAAPDEGFDGWRPPCARWADEDAMPLSCTKCILPTDAVDISLEAGYTFGRSGSNHAGSVDEVYTRLAETVAYLAQEDTQRANDKANWSRNRLAAFVERCRQADDADDCPLDVGHFQAQWCGRCEKGGMVDCGYMDRPFGDQWRPRPELAALMQVEECLDVDEKAYWMPVRVVPRCEMFVLAPQLVTVSRISFCTFPPDRRRRKLTVMRWMHHLLDGGGSRMYNIPGNPMGVWSSLRWLPYERGREKHFDRKKLVRYLLDNWDEWGDAKVATLMTVAASETMAMTTSAQRKVLHNAETGDDAWWIAINWSQYVGGEKPTNWPKKVDWPFVVKEQTEK